MDLSRSIPIPAIASSMADHVAFSSTTIARSLSTAGCVGSFEYSVGVAVYKVTDFLWATGHAGELPQEALLCKGQRVVAAK